MREPVCAEHFLFALSKITFKNRGSSTELVFINVNVN